MCKKIIKYAILFIGIPLLLALGFFVMRDKGYAYISLGLAVFACIPFFMSFEKKKNSARRLVLIAVMTALSVAGRFVFAPIPFFKPVTAVVVITALYMGEECGFLVGSLSAVISNFYFGQGPWTPFQMFAWGTVGFFAGVLRNPMLKYKLVLALYGLFSGALYSVLMDVWTTLWVDGTFNLARFLAAVASAAPVTLVYAVSNVLFLLVLTKPIGKKLERVIVKYGV